MSKLIVISVRSDFYGWILKRGFLIGSAVISASYFSNSKGRNPLSNVSIFEGLSVLTGSVERTTFIWLSLIPDSVVAT